MFFSKYQTALFLFLAALLFISCNENTPKRTTIFSKKELDREAFIKDLKNALSANIDSMQPPGRLRLLYAGNGYKPLWLDASGDVQHADDFLKDLENIKPDGIDPERYQLSALKKQLADYQANNKDIHAAISIDTTLTFQYLRASRDLLFGMVLPRTVDSLWFHANDSAWQTGNVLRSLSDSKYPSLAVFKSNLKVYAVLKKGLQHYQELLQNDSLRSLKSGSLSDDAIESILSMETPWLTTISDTLSGTAARIQAFQQYYGLKRTGKLDSVTSSLLKRGPGETVQVIAANMERIRWLPRDFESDYIVVNIPTMNFLMKRGEATIMEMNVVVGKPSRQTPALNAEMANIVINPPWGVPPTILKKDVLPGVLKSGSSYLRKKGLEAFDHKGRRIDASTITGSNYKRYTFRQPPGHSNALGYVKFNFPNKWDIYMHDTPHREDFEKFDRAKSSGCIRLQHPQDLAKYILADMEGRDYDQAKLDSVIAAGKTKWETLREKIPVHIIYLTACAEEGSMQIRFARDFYERDARLMAAISR